MKTRLEGKNYIIADSEYDKYRYVVDKETLNKTLDEIKQTFCLLQDKFKQIYDKDYDAYRTILSSNWELEKFDFDEGRSWVLNSIIENITLFQEQLSTDDDIKPIEELWTLEDEGFHTHDDKLFEKTIEDSEEKEVVEEVWAIETPIHRLRTIYWEKVPHGRHSRQIVYKDLPIDKKLNKYISNSIKVRKCV